MPIYNKFIPENVAPKNTKQIGVYNDSGDKVGEISLGPLSFPNASITGRKLYSFGLLSDVHITEDTALDDFQSALKFFNDNRISENIKMICISGDLADNGVASGPLQTFQTTVQKYSDLPVYVSAGNHDAYDANWNLRDESVVRTTMQTYTRKPLYYCITSDQEKLDISDDVFIFVGLCKDSFSQSELQWLYETLDKYKNRRCFLFQHALNLDGGCGNAFNLYSVNLLNNTRGQVFKSLLQHYHNVIWFHGHSHTKFHGQEYNSIANYDKKSGYHSVHVPSIALPRTDADGDGNFQTESADSEGYLVDVYEKGIHLRGRDFVTGEFLPIANYWLDTTIQEIKETYIDSTKTINTNI